MTANPNWWEVNDDPKDVEWQFKPHVMNRIYLQKMLVVIKYGVECQCFGVVIAYVRVLEFQKRALVHFHLFITLHPNCKQNSGRQLDMMIRAEIPDRVTEPKLYETVKRSMCHHLCHLDKIKKDLACHLKKNRCRFGFPHPFSNETVILGRGTTMRRRNNGATIEKTEKGKTVVYTDKNISEFSLF